MVNMKTYTVGTNNNYLNTWGLPRFFTKKMESFKDYNNLIIN